MNRFKHLWICTPFPVGGSSDMWGGGLCEGGGGSSCYHLTSVIIRRNIRWWKIYSWSSEYSKKKKCCTFLKFSKMLLIFIAESKSQTSAILVLVLWLILQQLYDLPQSWLRFTFSWVCKGFAWILFVATVDLLVWAVSIVDDILLWLVGGGRWWSRRSLLCYLTSASGSCFSMGKHSAE